MTTEAELVLMTLSREELDDANRYLSKLLDAWRSLSARESHDVGLSTDGPYHLLVAMRLALLRERTVRYGADPWFAGMPTTGHVAGPTLKLYTEMLALNADQRLAPRVSAAGILGRDCVICRQHKPLTVAFFDRPDGLWSDICRACGVIDAQALAAALDGPTAPTPPPQPDLAAGVDELAAEAYL